jgi:hypothetical protein
MSSFRGDAVVSTAAVGVPPTELPRETRGKSDRDGRGKVANDSGFSRGIPVWRAGGETARLRYDWEVIFQWN